MKKLTYLLTALILFGSGAFYSCNKVKDLLEVTIKDVEFTAQINSSNLVTKSDGFQFAGTVTIDPKDNPELAPYLETIRRVEVTNVKIAIDSVAPTSGLILNDAIFTIKDNVNDSTFTYTIPEAIPLAKGTVIQIGGDSPDYSTISDIISALHVVNLGVDGHTNQLGLVNFTFTIKADITVGVPRE